MILCIQSISKLLSVGLGRGRVRNGQVQWEEVGGVGVEAAMQVLLHLPAWYGWRGVNALVRRCVAVNLAE